MDNHKCKLKLKVKLKVKLKLKGGNSRAPYLNVVQSIDLRLGGAGDLSQACGADLHQIEKPLAIEVLLRPLDVERGRAKGLQRLSQIGDLTGKDSVSILDCFMRFDFKVVFFANIVILKCHLENNLQKTFKNVSIASP